MNLAEKNEIALEALDELLDQFAASATTGARELNGGSNENNPN